MSSNEEAIKRVIDSLADEIHDIDMGIIGESIGVSTAIDELREGLDKIDECLHQRKYEEASNLGYSDIASSFVFLQRALGGMLDVISDKEKLVSEIALKSGVGVYEEVEPFVDEVIGSLKIFTVEERARNKELAENKEYIRERRISSVNT